MLVKDSQNFLIHQKHEEHDIRMTLGGGCGAV